MELKYWLEEENDFIYVGDDINWLREQKAKGNAVIRLTKQGQPVSFLEDIRYVLEVSYDSWQQLDGDNSFYRKAYCHQKGKSYILTKTQELYIRELTMEDWPVLQQLEEEAILRGNKYLQKEQYYEKVSAVILEEYIQNYYNLCEDGIFAVVQRNTGQMIGMVGVAFTEDGQELKYALLPEYQGKGYAYAMCRALMGYFQSESEEPVDFFARIPKDNEKSRQLAKRLGITIYEVEEGVQN